MKPYVDFNRIPSRQDEVHLRLERWARWCMSHLDELTMYSYKTDQLTGKVIPLLEDKNNHVIDAIRVMDLEVAHANQG